MWRLMLVDDEENLLASLQRVCRKKKKWEIECYNNPQTALLRARSANFDLFLSDYRMPQMDGVQFLCEIKQLQPDAMRLILSGQTDREGLLDAINEAQIYHFIDKPWQDEALLTILQQALDHHDVMLENRLLANQVREQQRELDRRKQALDKYKEQHAELFKITWAADGSIVMDESE